MPIMDELQDVLREVFLDPSLIVNHHTTASDVAGWDSLSHVRLIMAIEDKFHVELNPSEASQAENLGELATIIQKRVRQGR